MDPLNLKLHCDNPGAQSHERLNGGGGAQLLEKPITLGSDRVDQR